MVAARYAYLVLAWAFVVGVVVQVFLIGLALFADPDSTQLHVDFGWILHLFPVLIVIAAAVARAGRRRILQVVALAAIVFVVPLLPGLRESAPVVAALHPVLALLAFGAAVGVAIAATRLTQAGRAVPG
ncbi:MAG: DUF6220 domain-containing protein [Chloroflexota bacterium]